MEGSYSDHPSSCLSSLLCTEDESCLNQLNEEDECIIPNNHSFVYEDDYFQSLLQKEARLFALYSSVSSSNYPSWLRDSRFAAINWILNTQTYFGFCNQTAYLSVTYLDRFLSRIHIHEDKWWAVRLLSIACLSLAAKMEECKVPALSEYPAEDYGFDSKVIQKMELLVLNTLEWKMSLITPFVYIPYLITKLGDQETNQDDLISKAVELLMALIKESNSIHEYRPSVIATAAVLAGSDGQLTQEALKLKTSSVSLWDTLDNQEQEPEQLYSCYSLMQRLSANKANPSTPSLIMSEVDENNLRVSPRKGGTKRRRLTFNEEDKFS